MVEGNKLSLSWLEPTLLKEETDVPFKPSSSIPGQGSGHSDGGYVGPLEQLNRLCLSQGWGSPEYTCMSWGEGVTGQHVYQYHVSVKVSQSHIYGEASHDRLLALINCACAALQAISAASMQQFSSPPPYSMTVLQPPPGIRRRGISQTIVRPTREETNLLGEDLGGGNASSLTSVTPMDIKTKDSFDLSSFKTLHL